VSSSITYVFFWTLPDCALRTYFLMAVILTTFSGILWKTLSFSLSISFFFLGYCGLADYKPCPGGVIAVFALFSFLYRDYYFPFGSFGWLLVPT